MTTSWWRDCCYSSSGLGRLSNCESPIECYRKQLLISKLKFKIVNQPCSPPITSSTGRPGCLPVPRTVIIGEPAAASTTLIRSKPQLLEIKWLSSVRILIWKYKPELSNYTQRVDCWWQRDRRWRAEGSWRRCRCEWTVHECWGDWKGWQREE